MNLAYIEFYNDILIELESLLTLDYTNNIVKNYMSEIKKYSLKQAKKINLDENFANDLFDKKKGGTKIYFDGGIKINIPKELQNIFGGYKKGYLKYHYNPRKVYELKNQKLDIMLIKLINFGKTYPNINIDSLVDAIDIEKGYTKYFLKDECEFMQIVCGNKKDKAVFDVYGNDKINLPEYDIQNHIRLVGKKVISDIRVENFFKLYSSEEIISMLKKYKTYFSENKNNDYYNLIYKK